MATTTRKLTDRIRIGIGLISMTVAIFLVASLAIVRGTDIPALKVLIGILALALIVVPWFSAVRNSRFDRATRERLRLEHPGALVERVRLWALPHGRIEPGTPVHFIIADAGEVSFETVEQMVLLRIPTPEIGFLDPVRAQGDRTRDQALTIIYGDEQNTVQFFTVSYDGLPRFAKRLRTAIGWPATGTPAG